MAELLSCDDIREKLAYRHDNFPNSSVLEEVNSPDKVYRDAFDGERYAKPVGKGHFDNKYDIALKLDIDGFRSKYSNTRLIMFYCIILNYDITEVRLIFMNSVKKNII